MTKYAILCAIVVQLSVVPGSSVGAQTCEPGECCCSKPSATTAPATAVAADLQLTRAESDALVAMRREEKLAHDVYVALGKRFDLMPFKRIPMSESRHMEAMLALLNRYGIPDPVAGLPEGKFDDAAVQKLYDEYVARGSAGEAEALAVGAEIEELDIKDLRTAASTTTRQEILVVLQTLERASGNHLRAFMRNLATRGQGYTPKHLSQTEFDKLLD